MVIVVDDGQHFSDEAAKYDRIRDEHMRSLSLRVLRFTNIDVLTNMEERGDCNYLHHIVITIGKDSGKEIIYPRFG